MLEVLEAPQKKKNWMASYITDLNWKKCVTVLERCTVYLNRIILTQSVGKKKKKKKKIGEL
jgi:hypothetical protein